MIVSSLTSKKCWDLC